MSSASPQGPLSSRISIFRPFLLSLEDTPASSPELLCSGWELGEHSDWANWDLRGDCSAVVTAGLYRPVLVVTSHPREDGAG